MTRILTDSSAGMTLEDVKKIGVEMVHIPITFDDGADFLDGKNLTIAEFYKKQAESKKLPTTSAINQATFEEVFNDVKKRGDEMVVLLLSSGLSVTTEQAMKAKEAVGYNKIYIVDALATVGTLIALVMEAVKLRDKKMSGAQIEKEIVKLVPKVKLFAYLETLKYLRAGGRISGVSAVVGTMLNVKPSLAIVNGKLESVHKSVGVKKAAEWVISQFNTHDVDLTKPVYFGHANRVSEAEKLKEMAREVRQFTDGGNWMVSATVATHTGPGAVYIVYFVK